MAIAVDTPAAIPVRSHAWQAADAVFGHAIERFAAHRERRRVHRALLAYRRIDNRMLDDIGLSTAIVEGALAGEADATATFARWMRARRIG